MTGWQPIALLILLCSFLGGCVSDSSLVGDRSSRLEWHPRFHTAERGDTLYSIAWSYGQDYQRVAQWNGISAPYIIRPGQRIRVAPPPDFGRPRSSEKQASLPGAGSRGGGKRGGVTSSVPQSSVRVRPLARVPTPAGNPLPAPVMAPASGLLPDDNKEVDWRWPTTGIPAASANGSGQLRPGINIEGRRGQPVYAAATGKVVYSGSGLIGYGKLIILKHNNQYLSAYAHNWELLVKEGEQVTRGVQIAKMGSSGAEKVMLHFEIRQDGKPVDPLSFLPKRQGPTLRKMTK